MERSYAKDDSKSGVKAYRHIPELENFYRYVFENNLREEARYVIETVLTKCYKTKKTRRSKSRRKHIQ